MSRVAVEDAVSTAAWDVAGTGDSHSALDMRATPKYRDLHVAIVAIVGLTGVPVLERARATVP
jgi:hypothetical protein